jgi:hypothetical protein
MNIERGARRLLVLVTAVLVLVMAGWSVLLSHPPPASCTYLVILADGTVARIPAPEQSTREQVETVARRLHPDTKTPLVIGPGELTLFEPQEPVTPESCSTERVSARVVRYVGDVTTGAAVALMIAAVLWIAFFALRWVARGFKSEA